MPPSDRELVARLRARDAAAFDALYARYAGRLWSFLRRLATRADVAEDLFQDTWLGVARAAPTLAEDTDLDAWLFTVARNRFRSHLRWRAFDRVRQALVATTPAPRPRPPDEEAEARADVRRLERALAGLAPAHREVLLLAGTEDFDGRQLAEILGVGHDAVRKRLSRAREELARRLEDDDGGDTAARGERGAGGQR